MNRLVIAIATAAAACGVAIPAVAGLSGNPSFSQRIPVRLPSSAHVVQFDTSGSVVREADDRRSASAVPTTAATTKRVPAEASPTATSATRSQHRELEPGDDHGGARTTSTTEPGDDRGKSGGRGSGRRGSDDGGHDG